jgi:hypothetical protein
MVRQNIKLNYLQSVFSESPSIPFRIICPQLLIPVDAIQDDRQKPTGQAEALPVCWCRIGPAEQSYKRPERHPRSFRSGSGEGYACRPHKRKARRVTGGLSSRMWA